MNIKWARTILHQLAEQGVKTICLCPGARNAPFVELLQNQNQFEVISFFDERSAGFFALGRAQRDCRPVVVCTTSGTAVSELLSPVIEAYYTCSPLVVLSADRPKRLRGTGAPQSIEQSHMFKAYVESSLDVEAGDAVQIQLSGREPVQINVCFDEPLVDETPDYGDKMLQSSWRPKELPVISENSDSVKKAVIVVGRLSSQEKLSVEKNLETLKVPIFVEASSGLRESLLLKDSLLQGGDKAVSALLKSGDVESVIRIGNVPLGRFWRDLDQMNLKTISFTAKPWSGTDKSKVFQVDLEKLNLSNLEILPWDWSAWKEWGEVKEKQTLGLFEKFPLSEVSFFNQVGGELDKYDSIYVGNSLPVRMWDMTCRHSRLHSANRGANGIDGQLSTALGLMQPKTKNLVILGDLTALYDFSGLWLSEYMRAHEVSVHMVVVNNFGGQIFSRIFQNPLFRNEHQLDFKNFATMWGWDYQLQISPEPLKNLSGMALVEWRPDKNQSQSFWEEYDQLWKK